LFLFVATLMWLPPTVHAEVTAVLLVLVVGVPIARRWFANHPN
jgi:hypothetical protein